MSASRSVARTAVVGHVEWVRLARVREVPRAGQIVHALDPLEEPAGGGAVAAVQLARLGGEAMFLTALGEDRAGALSKARLGDLGVRVFAASRQAPTRAAVTLVDDRGERTITTFGERLEPVGSDAGLPWERLAEFDAVYFTAGDHAALRAARAARVLVASPRATQALGRGVSLDALVLSASDEGERSRAAGMDSQARLTVLTEGGEGGTYTTSDGRSGSWAPSAPPGPVGDSYGCGDSFAAGLTYGLALGLDVDRAVQLGARCGAVCLTGRGPYERQLSAEDLALP